MTKLVAIIRREYLKRVRSVGFILSTVLGPLLLAATFVIPLLIAFIQPSSPTVAVLDQSGKIYEPLRAAVEEHRGWSTGYAKEPSQAHDHRPLEIGSLPSATNLADFKIEKVETAGRSLAEVKSELTARVLHDRLDAFLIIAPDVLTTGQVEYYSRTSGDPIGNEQFDDYLSRAIIEQRLAQAGVSQSQLRELTERVGTNRIRLSAQGEEKTTGAPFLQVMGVGLLLFITLVSDSGSIFSAVMEERESRLAEILFSSVRSFTLLLGKLIGVSLVAFTQYAIWMAAFFAIYGAAAASSSGTEIELVHLPGLFFVYLITFFLVGYFIFATIYTVVGAMMTSPDENSWAALLATAPLMVAFSLAMPVMRGPNSWMAIIASLIPFFSPILMPIRIITRTPPAWQILLSIFIGLATILLLLRLAARVYHIGMLMYGKKVSVPEVMRWMRQA